MRHIGLHLRLTTTLSDLIEKALRLQLSFFQCFFVLQAKNRLIQVSDEDKHIFLEFRRKYFEEIFLHVSYWVNLANHYVQGENRVLQRELELAKRLEFTHIILHPGSAKGVEFREEGITILANALNRVLKREHDIVIVLENTAHGGMAVGSNLQDFGQLLAKLDYPDRVKFCIDTAHAYAYGYDIATQSGQNEFIALLEKTIGIERIALIHLNDTREKLGSKIDRHCMLGDGLLGDDVLKSFMLLPVLCAIPVLMELPAVSEEKELEIVQKVRGWYEKKEGEKND